MKWKVKQPPKECVVKYATIFPLIPRLIKDSWYWLERVDVKYKKTKSRSYIDYYGSKVKKSKWVLVGLNDRLEIECK